MNSIRFHSTESIKRSPLEILWKEDESLASFESKAKRDQLFRYEVKKYSFKMKQPTGDKLLKQYGKPLQRYIGEENIPVHLLEKQSTILNFSKLEKQLVLRKLKKARKVNTLRLYSMKNDLNSAILFDMDPLP
jgi:hypothetical protein